MCILFDVISETVSRILQKTVRLGFFEMKKWRKLNNTWRNYNNTYSTQLQAGLPEILLVLRGNEWAHHYDVISFEYITEWQLYSISIYWICWYQQQ